MGLGECSWTVMDHALQNLIERGVWVRWRMLNTLVTFGKIWVSWHRAASQHNMHQRLASNSLNCILMSWWLWRLFLNQIGALELHLVLINLMHLPSSNVLREWKRDTKGVLLSYSVSRALLTLWQVYKALQSAGHHHKVTGQKSNEDQCTEPQDWESGNLPSGFESATGPLCIFW